MAVCVRRANDVDLPVRSQCRRDDFLDHRIGIAIGELSFHRKPRLSQRVGQDVGNRYRAGNFFVLALCKCNGGHLFLCVDGDEDVGGPARENINGRVVGLPVGLIGKLQSGQG